MTKSEFLTNCNFNNLPLKEAISKANELLDSNFNTIPGKHDDELKIKCDKDGNPTEEGTFIRTNQELSEAMEQLREDFPMLGQILKSLRVNKFDTEKTFQELLQARRDHKVCELLK